MAIPVRVFQTSSEAQTPCVILAIDYGQKRLGLALSDECGVTSRPYATWTRTNRRRDLARLREFVRQHGVRRVIVGLPLHLDGTPSEMSKEAAKFASRIEKNLGLPVEMIDERLSSWEARRTLSVSNPNPRARRVSPRGAGAKRKQHLDEIAAAIILQDYLDRAHTRAGSRG